MRLSDLLRMDAVDATGRAIGSVDDVRLRIEGDEAGIGRARWIVDAVVVGRGALGRRLGYDNVTEQGPALVAALMQRVGRRARVLRWDQVARIEGDTIVASVGIGDLPHPSDDRDGAP